MLETISEADPLKQKSEEQVDDMRKLQETLKLLKDKKGSFKVFNWSFQKLYVDIWSPFWLKSAYRLLVVVIYNDLIDAFRVISRVKMKMIDWYGHRKKTAQNIKSQNFKTGIFSKKRSCSLLVFIVKR